MSLIISSESMVRDEAHRRGQAALAQFRSAIRPIYRGDGQSMPTHVGTCTLFRIGNEKFIATAAHIIDQYTDVQLWVGGAHALIPLSGLFSSTLAPEENRGLDKFDFSVSPVLDELAAGLADVAYIKSEFISRGRRADRKHAMYTCIGYPNSQNKELHADKREINVRMWMHTSQGRSTYPELAAWAAQTTAHIFVDFHKYAEKLDGSKRNSTNPKGTSGGPVFYLGDFSDPDTFRRDSKF